MSSPQRALSPQADILVVDDEAEMRATVRLVLQRLNIRTFDADTGAAGIAAARLREFNLALIDFRLGDTSGLEVIKVLKRDRVRVPCILMSGWMTIPIAVEAMKLGAIDALSLPFDIETVLLAALKDLRTKAKAAWPRIPLAPVLRTPKSVAEKWAWLVLRACDTEHDLKTLGEWASLVGTSYSSLTAICRLVGVSPHDSRDFARVLRALIHSSGRLENLGLVLLVSDERTLDHILQRASFDRRRLTGTVSLHEFLDQQRFVQPGHEVLAHISAMCAAPFDPHPL